MLTLLAAFLVAFTALLYGVCSLCPFFGRHATVIRGSGDCLPGSRRHTCGHRPMQAGQVRA